MPKNNKKKQNSSKGGAARVSHQLTLAEEEGQTYGIVTKTLGDRHFTVSCQDGKVRRCKVRGKMKNRNWVKDSDVVLITTRDFDDDEGDIIDIYTSDDVRTLKKGGYVTIGTNNEGKVAPIDSDTTEVTFEESFNFSTI